MDKPEPGKEYALTGKTGDKCIANGNTWRESEVKENGVLGAGTRQTEKNKIGSKKERTFRVTSYETCHFEQIVKVPEVYTDGEYDQGETEGLAIEKAGEIGEWGNAEYGEVQDQEAQEINGN